METMTTTQGKAAEASQWFETRTRDDGSTFVTLKDDRPEWVHELVMEAHGDYLPDDYRYSWIQDAVEAIEAGDEDGEDIEADIYNSDLLKWVSSNLYRMGYVDEAMEESHQESLAYALMAGQEKEKRETFDAVLTFLQNMEDVDEDEDS